MDMATLLFGFGRVPATQVNVDPAGRKTRPGTIAQSRVDPARAAIAKIRQKDAL
jgi:hypothetical protein